IIATIKESANRGEAREKLLEKIWDSGTVVAMLQAAGRGTLAAGDLRSVRPEFIEGEDLKKPFGLIDNGNNYRLSLEQVNAILEMQLHRLTGLEQDKLTEEYQDLLRQIAELESILA